MAIDRPVMKPDLVSMFPYPLVGHCPKPWKATNFATVPSQLCPCAALDSEAEVET